MFAAATAFALSFAVCWSAIACAWPAVTFVCAVSAAACAEIVADFAFAQAVLVGSGVQALDSFCFAVCKALFAFESAVWFC